MIDHRSRNARRRRIALALAIVASALIGLSAAAPAQAEGICIGTDCDTVAFIDDRASFHLYSALTASAPVTSFVFGNPGDEPLMGDWNCDGEETPGMYRRSSGYMYLRNGNDSGGADRQFYFGNPDDVPLAGDFDGDGCDTLSIYRPAEARVYVSNELGNATAGFSFQFGNPGDTPFVGDFNGDGVDSVGLHRPSTGLVYFRHSLTSGVADESFVFGNPGDVILAGDWDGDGRETVGAYRPAEGALYLTNRHASGVADHHLSVGRYVHAAARNGSSKRSSEPVPEPHDQPQQETYLYDDFGGHASPWPQGATVGPWNVRYDGYGSVGLTGDGRLRLVPRTASEPNTTYAALVVSTQAFPGDVDLITRVETAQQLRTGTPPNAWEVPWVVWHYEHDHRFYYVILRPSGWELGKVDNTKLDPAGPECVWPTYANCRYPGAQRYLATGTSPSFALGEPHEVRVVQTGNQIVVWGDDHELTRLVDQENPYLGGQIGLYTEDADALFDSVSVKSLHD